MDTLTDIAAFVAACMVIAIVVLLYGAIAFWGLVLICARSSAFWIGLSAIICVAIIF